MTIQAGGKAGRKRRSSRNPSLRQAPCVPAGSTTHAGTQGAWQVVSPNSWRHLYQLLRKLGVLVHRNKGHQTK
jgi:hypothetical protein